MSDNTTVVAYLKKQGGILSRVAWSELHLVTLSARYIPGKKNILANQLSHLDQVLPTEWFLLSQVFDARCEVYIRPHMDLFATKVNTKFP